MNKHATVASIVEPKIATNVNPAHNISEMDSASIPEIGTFELGEHYQRLSVNSVLEQDAFRALRHLALETVEEVEVQSSQYQYQSTPTLTGTEAPSQRTLTKEEIAVLCGKDILAKKYSWIKSPCSKLMYILPQDPDVAIREMTWEDFDVHFLCDCADIGAISERSEVPTTAAARTAFQDSCPIVDDVSHYGDQFMTVLEMMKYSVTIDGNVKVKKIENPDVQELISIAIAFLVLKDFMSCEQFANLIDVGNSFGNNFAVAVKTPKGDIRYVCANHRMQLFPEFDPQLIFKCIRPGLSSNHSWDPQTGTLFIHLQSREDTESFYQLVPKLRAIVVLAVFLDWDLYAEDNLKLQLMISNITSKDWMRIREVGEDALIPGFGHRYYQTLLSAILNTRIDAFSLERLSPGDEIEEIDLWEFRSLSTDTDVCIARFTRTFEEHGMDLGVLMTDIDQAVASL
ncbi:hypothetical protein BGZ83_009636 [Gryganskiella cystojenkinii]|nr:hypothetical protein BGZ83_009636 [Gryganskiella cystojenkinii]